MDICYTWASVRMWTSVGRLIAPRKSRIQGRYSSIIVSFDVDDFLAFNSNQQVIQVVRYSVSSLLC